MEEDQEYYEDDSNETDQYDNEDVYYETDDQLSQEEEGGRRQADSRMVALIKPIAAVAGATLAVPQPAPRGKPRGQKTLNFYFTW